MKNPILVCVLLIVAIVVGLIMNSNKSDQATRPPANQSETNEAGEPSNTDNKVPLETESDEQAAATITYTNSGFSPGSITIKSGQSVTVTNESSMQLDFASDDHPAHRDNSELNVGIIPAGQSKTFTLTRKGTWGYHNHLAADDSGRIIVE